MDITIENGKTPIIANGFNAKFLLYTKKISTAHFVSKNNKLHATILYKVNVKVIKLP